MSLKTENNKQNHNDLSKIRNKTLQQKRNLQKNHKFETKLIKKFKNKVNHQKTFKEDSNSSGDERICYEIPNVSKYLNKNKKFAEKNY